MIVINLLCLTEPCDVRHMNLLSDWRDGDDDNLPRAQDRSGPVRGHGEDHGSLQGADTSKLPGSGKHGGEFEKICHFTVEA